MQYDLCSWETSLHELKLTTTKLRNISFASFAHNPFVLNATQLQVSWLESQYMWIAFRSLASCHTSSLEAYGKQEQREQVLNLLQGKTWNEMYCDISTCSPRDVLRYIDVFSMRYNAISRRGLQYCVSLATMWRGDFSLFVSSLLFSFSLTFFLLASLYFFFFLPFLILCLFYWWLLLRD